MITRPLVICILAAGKGTRMNSSIPKVLHKLKNITLIERVIDAGRKFNCTKNLKIINYLRKKIDENINIYLYC